MKLRVFNHYRVLSKACRGGGNPHWRDPGRLVNPVGKYLNLCANYEILVLFLLISEGEAFTSPALRQAGLPLEGFFVLIDRVEASEIF